MAIGNGQIKDIIQDRQSSSVFDGLTLGEVVDTNDPQQMGRLRVVCPALGDDMNMQLSHIPWASYVTPFGGMTETTARGRDDGDTTKGPVSYGMWNIPKVGSTVLVACLDGDTHFRLWLGCLVGQYFPHTMPHGRFNGDGGSTIDGPVSSTEQPIQPSHKGLTSAFTKSKDSVTAGLISTPRESFEFRTRGADYTVAAVTESAVASPDSSISSISDNIDVKVTENDGNVIGVTQGYSESRVEPPITFVATNNKNYDPQTYNWTTPGFHSMSMDDRQDNCRIRLRTTHGHQIILDDTNERMYISTPNGDTWIELDETGNIDIYGKRNISMHAEQDINFTTDKTFRVKAKEGIHLISEDQVRVHAKGGEGIHVKSNTKMHIEAIESIHVKTSDVLFLSSVADTNINVTGSLKVSSRQTMNVLSGDNIIVTGGPNIHLNGPPAEAAEPAEVTKEAFWTDRIPEHEPWARGMTKQSSTDVDYDNAHVGSAEYLYDDAQVGRIERGEDLHRNKMWHR